MRLQIWPAAFAGIVGAIVMMMSRMVLMKATGVRLRMNVPRMWGTMVGLHGTPGRIVGLLMHLAVSAGIGLVYAWVYDRIEVRHRMWFWGLVGAVVHWLLAGIFLVMVPPMHPEIPERRPAPGPFARNFGVPDTLGFLLGHLAYGLTFANVYATLRPKGAVEVTGRPRVAPQAGRSE